VRLSVAGFVCCRMPLSQVTGILVSSSEWGKSKSALVYYGSVPKMLTYHWVTERFVRSAREMAEGPICEFDASSSSSGLVRPDLEASSIRGRRFEVKIGDLEKGHFSQRNMRHTLNSFGLGLRGNVNC
jgi:hypothetical protein